MMESEIRSELNEIERIMEAARKQWEGLDPVNTGDDFILYSLAYLGRSTDAKRNEGLDRKDMLRKAAGLLIEAAIRC